ncbi:hypothetical protein A3A55_03500 [Candidatus Roizmanbacteria bacterium RIFCSPLOWO2_01_FULL_40_14]|nr:MAG: hypothetical protein A3A55_03500 [Candidatus Roizmanbacteria bacterium RIFCSPLOWO2_01_FULL_40_14]
MKPSYVVSHPGILGGKPVIRGTRIAVSTIVDLAAAGMAVKEISKEYPSLTKEAIQAALFYAAERVNHETIRPILNKDGSLSFPQL